MATNPVQGNQSFGGVQSADRAYNRIYQYVNQNGLDNNYGNAISIGLTAGLENQGQNSIAIGTNAGEYGQGYDSIAIGTNSGQLSQAAMAISIGGEDIGSPFGPTFQINQGEGAISIGAGAGTLDQGTAAISIGLYSAIAEQKAGAVSIGAFSGMLSQGTCSISIGSNIAAFYPSFSAMQGEFAISVGNYAFNEQSGNTIAIGGNIFGPNFQDTGAISIGYLTSTNIATQGYNAISIGSGAGDMGQNDNSILIKSGDGNFYQNYNSITIGCGSGNFSQSYNAIDISTGYGDYHQVNDSIILNASNTNLTASDSAFYVNPVRIYGNGGINNPVMYNNSTKELFVNTNKTFVIDHPLDSDKYLVHACVESPSSNLFYNGVGKIENGAESVNIELPSYVEKIGRDFTVSLTCKGKNGNLYTNGVVDGKYFTVFGVENSEFFWHVYGLMGSIVAEPNKKDVKVKGDGPYKYIKI